jgi:hypothetical protein
MLAPALNSTDAFLQRKQEKRRVFRDPKASQSSFTKFRDKKVLYKRGEEQLWDLLNRIDALKDL